MVTTTTNARHSTSEKIPERIANIIKALALTINKIANNIQNLEGNSANPVANESETETQSRDTSFNKLHKQLKMNINFLNDAASSQAKATEKANALLGKLEQICNQTEMTVQETEQSAETVANTATTYRDALVNGGDTNPAVPHTPLPSIDY